MHRVLDLDDRLYAKTQDKQQQFIQPPTSLSDAISKRAPSRVLQNVQVCSSSYRAPAPPFVFSKSVSSFPLPTNLGLLDSPVAFPQMLESQPVVNNVAKPPVNNYNMYSNTKTDNPEVVSDSTRLGLELFASRPESRPQFVQAKSAYVA